MNSLRYLPFLSRGLRHKGPPLHLTLFVTGQCNLRCRHCFHFAEVAAGIPGPSAEEVDRLAQSASRMGPLLWVSFGGGEPFLRPDLEVLARSFGSRGLRHLAIPTNGLVPKTGDALERILDTNPELFLSVAVSIDGPPAIHDSIRASDGAHGRSLEGLSELLALGRERERLGVGIITTLTRENQAVLAGHLDELAREYRPDNLTINLARGDALDPSLLEVDLARYREVVETKRSLMREGVLPYFEFPLSRLAAARDDLLYERVEQVAGGAIEPHLSCTAGSLSAVIFENGSVHPCEILGEEIGTLADTDWDLERLWKSERADALRRRIVETRCTCTWECAQADNLLFSPRNWPRLAKRALSL